MWLTGRARSLATRLVGTPSAAGPGSPPPVDGIACERRFKPFFAPKDVGKGSGFDLSRTFGFAKQSGGEAADVSAPGRGTTFIPYLPEVEPGRRKASCPSFARAENGAAR
jgi:C4-dicarboxylate-specific signal transduction histidine kinase